MKTKNLIYGIAGFMAMVMSANADDKTEALKQKCMRSLGTYWVEANNICVPRNPCDSKWDYKWVRQGYCITDFKNVQFAYPVTAENAALYYLQNKIGEGHGIQCHSDVANSGGKEHFIGDDYIPCTTNDGRYVVFQVDDTTNGTTEIGELARVLGESMGGKCGVSGSNNHPSVVCTALSQEECDKLGKQMRTFNSDKTGWEHMTMNFDSSTKECRSTNILEYKEPKAF